MFSIPFLLEAQNPDGGWGYRAGAQSGAEPTSWALQALFTAGKQVCVPAPADKPQTLGNRSALPLAQPDLLATEQPSRLAEAVNAGMRWLCDAQLPDGSWPAFVGQSQGCWVTAPACLALHAWSSADLYPKVSGLSGQASDPAGFGFQSRDSSLVTRHSSLPKSSDRVARGLQWLCRTWPAEGNWWWRLRQRLGRQASVVRQDSSLRGWSWTPGTASWVEPTSYALIAFRRIPEELHPRGTSKRRQLGVKMLYDRMCPGGGWNSGNALIYGVAGEPRVGPTAWALLALQDCRERPQNRQSLDWLEQTYPGIRGPASLALAHLCLQAYDRPLPALEPALSELWQNNQFFHDVLTNAWAAIALNSEVRSQRCHRRSRIE